MTEHNTNADTSYLKALYQAKKEAITDGRPIDYWLAVRDIALENDHLFGRTCDTIVCGMSVYDGDFEGKLYDLFGGTQNE